jgi:hypothetical protein
MAEDRGISRPDIERVLSGLKPFQRRSVDYVFDRLYGADATPRFLLADEVGLGKTLVAKGVIARAIDRLWDETDRIDIVYICSNHDIARQNINRLNLTGKKDFALASRITLLGPAFPSMLVDSARRSHRTSAGYCGVSNRRAQSLDRQPSGLTGVAGRIRQRYNSDLCAALNFHRGVVASAGQRRE